MKQKAKLGDIFLIPTGEEKFSAGQIAGKYREELYTVVYEGEFIKDDFSVESILDRDIIFSALTLDALLYHGHWSIVGNNTNNLEKIPQPLFKVDQDGEMWVDSRDRKRRRLATRSEAEILRYRVVTAPIGLEKAVKAYYKHIEWEGRYNEFLSDYAIESSKIHI